MTSSTDSSKPSFDHKAFLKKTSCKPGVYDMRDQQGHTLYIGKAKNLKNRLSSYFQASGLSTKTMALISKVADIDVIVTNSETEALLLEQNLIKLRKPPYNILLRDDKSYPYIVLASEDSWPRLGIHRGKKVNKDRYFGPYPSSSAVRDNLNLLQKVFKVRQCEDSYFRNRSRPCLQYQIRRCKAPCVGLVREDEYARDVLDSIQLISGKCQELTESLAQRMENASRALNFELAADIRDQIIQLRKVQEGQSVIRAGGSADIIGYAEQSGSYCFHVLFVRDGQVIGSKAYFPKFKLEKVREEYLDEFSAQFYINLSQNRDFPEELILPFRLSSISALKEAINQLSGKKIEIKEQVRGDRKQWLNLANKNAEQSLKATLLDQTRMDKRVEQLMQLLELPSQGQRLECFDISHTMGEATVASCVVFNREGPLKSDYRRFNIKDISPGDDYAAMGIALQRRYQKLVASGKPCPDLIFIDGGKGQLSAAETVMADLDLSGIPLLGVAKGKSRKPGLETLLYQGRELITEGYEAALLLIQHIRDEAHRFAIAGHRQKRHKTRNRSLLEDIPGVGGKRRSALLKYFGGQQGVVAASVNELAKVPGISQQLADTIYNFLHE